ncbi:hypothetical protein K443DRAFT_317781 [Laccaria amethystina LaAM-08-1]|uniref:Uncharacterized protein n=1 Tax=Laccaria amethystina LaAM-08-1 TaxID=1095629 RepID=A0A0C9Y6S4_9AGAR|nr:hypothetical protein K443DRAFT_317781 [Laccaria amethystina LaAM-08-1]
MSMDHKTYLVPLHRTWTATRCFECSFSCDEITTHFTTDNNNRPFVAPRPFRTSNLCQQIVRPNRRPRWTLESTFAPLELGRLGENNCRSEWSSGFGAGKLGQSCPLVEGALFSLVWQAISSVCVYFKPTVAIPKIEPVDLQHTGRASLISFVAGGGLRI